MHVHTVPAPVEIVTATINLSLQMNYSITADWKVGGTHASLLFGINSLTLI